MNQIYAIVSRASWRLTLIHWFRTLAILATVAIAIALIALLVERVFGLGTFFAPLWMPIVTWTPVAVLALATAWSLFRRKSAPAVARELDERAGLREALSTAICFEKSQDAWGRAVVENAQRTAATVQVGRAIPIEAPRFWPVPVGAALAFLVVWIALPVIDVMGIWAKQTAAEDRVREVTAVKADVQQATDKVKEMLAKAKIEFVDEEGAEASAEQKPTDNDPEAIRRAAVKKLTEMTDKLEGMKEGEKADQMEALKEAMRQLRQPGPGPMDEFSRSLARGDFNKAQEALEQMKQQLANGDMSPEQREEAKKQMENLAKQLEKIAENKEALAKKLEEAGLDKEKAKELLEKAATDPQALKEALEQNKGLSEEQKQELMQMCKSGMGACQSAENMSEALSKMAQGMTQEGLQQEGAQGMQELSQELSNSEMMESDMENLDAALQEAKQQLAKLGEQCMGDGECNGNGDQPGKGQGGWRQGSSNNRGQGSGGPGQGNGASPEAEAVDFTVEKNKAKVKTNQGPIIGTRLVYGQQVKGESKAEFSEAVAVSSAAAAEAVESQQVPRELHNAVKHYFGTLEGKVKSEKPAPKPAEPPSEEDAE